MGGLGGSHDGVRVLKRRKREYDNFSKITWAAMRKLHCNRGNEKLVGGPF